jgi:Transposase DDE domain group 1
MENRLKELQQGLAMDRTSCSRFAANQLRLLFSVAAYGLFQALQILARARRRSRRPRSGRCASGC